MTDFLLQPWPWWFSGPLIGLTVPLLYLLAGKGFGISTSFQQIGALCSPPQQTRLSEELRSSSRNLDARLRTWNRDRRFHWKPVALGGTDRISSRQILQHWGSHQAIHWWVLSSDSERGTRGGCTSGHAITGIANWNFPKCRRHHFLFRWRPSASLGAWDTFFSKVI